MRFIVEKAMRHGHVPTFALPRGDVCERVESWLVFLHSAAPHDELEIWELDHLTIEGRDDLHVGTRLRKIVPVVDRVSVEAVVIAGEDDCRALQAAELFLGEGDGFVRYTVMIKEITGDEQQVNSFCNCLRHNGLKAAIEQGAMCLALLGFTITITVKMHVGSMQQFQGSGAALYHSISHFGSDDEPVGRH